MTEALSLYLPADLAAVLSAMMQCTLLLALAASTAYVFVWAERKVSARIQDRLGPTRVGGAFGWLQLLADGIKLVCKEDTVPKGADQLLFRAAPYIAFAAVFLAYAALPFADRWVALDLDVGAFFILAVLGLQIFGVILGGYASGSKWSLFGAMREAAQVVSYEVPLGLCVVVVVLIAGSMNLNQIANLQAGWFTSWLLFHDPFTFITFFVFCVCATASVNRAPFDLAEAESELVAGFHTEYSGMRWSFFFLAEYAAMFLVSGLAAVLFLGGWHGPVPLGSWLGLVGPGWAGYLGNLLGVLTMLIKSTLGVVVMIWVRWSLPRLRIDQVLDVCLKYCLPIVSVMLLAVSLWQLLLPGGLLPHQPAAIGRFQARGVLSEAPPDVAPANLPDRVLTHKETPKTVIRNPADLPERFRVSPKAP